MIDNLAVFGSPIEHSMSPSIHNYFAKLTNKNINYQKILSAKEEFTSKVTEFFNSGAIGCNITVPCKKEAFLFADIHTTRAKDAQVCNVLKKMPDGTILGDNTDGAGLCLDLEDKGIDLKHSKILIVGAGGASLGILNPLLYHGVKTLYWTNRTYDKLADLYNNFDKNKQQKIHIFNINNLPDDVDLIINASSSSLYNDLPKIDDNLYSKASFVYDLMYSKDGQTIFTKHAKNMGTKQVFDGFGMLIMQALLSFELWYDIKLNRENLVENLRQQILNDKA